MASTVSEAQLFWSQVAEKRSLFNPEARLVINGKDLGMKLALQTQMYHSCNKSEKFASEYFQSPPARVVDIGSGMGANSIPMACAGAHVTAIDSSRELLEDFADFTKLSLCPSKNIRLCRGNLTTVGSYDGPYDLALAIDILPFIPPPQLKSTMDKIHACLADGGLLVGTIFTEGGDTTVIELLENLGAHFYPNGITFAQNLLKYSGFRVLELEKRKEGGFRFKAQKISA
jgi:cyclopropane fatty-acyl-phospholipid synthase-like methyltransferase